MIMSGICDSSSTIVELYLRWFASIIEFASSAFIFPRSESRSLLVRFLERSATDDFRCGLSFLTGEKLPLSLRVRCVRMTLNLTTLRGDLTAVPSIF